MRYKYFYKTDKKKETVGTVSAPSLEIAYEYASQIKKLGRLEFIKLFKVEKLKHGK
jgi:hypothetical protein